MNIGGRFWLEDKGKAFVGRGRVGAGFFATTTSPASTVNRFAVDSPTTWVSTASTDGLAEVDATANFQPAASAASAILLIPDRGGIAPDEMICW
jgi:hypothetical protein